MLIASPSPIISQRNTNSVIIRTTDKNQSGDDMDMNFTNPALRDKKIEGSFFVQSNRGTLNLAR